MHYPLDAERAYPLHCVGQELPPWVGAGGCPADVRKLFGEDDEAGDEAELDAAKASGENADEIDNLKQEAAAFRKVRKLLSEEDGPQRVFRKVGGWKWP